MIGDAKALFRALLRDQRGVSAVEFALIASVLFGGLLSTVDIGLAVTERMNLDSVLRAGANAAMADPGETGVLKVLKATASENFTLSDETNATAQHPVTLSAVRFCACAEDTTAPVDCSTTCSGLTQTFAYYRLTAAKTYNGLILPQIDFKAEMQVQVR